MKTPGDDGNTVRDDRAARRAQHLSPASIFGAFLGLVLIVGAPLTIAASAHAASGATTTPVPSASRGTPTPTPTGPVAPTIVDPGDITSSTQVLTGTGTPGDTLRIRHNDTSTATVCTATVTTGGTWSCTATMHSGPQQVFEVVDTSTQGLATAKAPASDVIVPPSVTTNGLTAGGVSGTGTAGASVQVTASGTSATRSATIGRNGQWFVSWSTGANALHDGTVTLTATQTASTALGYRSELRSSASAPANITIDRTAPAAPRISSPAASARISTQPITVAGTGNDGDVVTVYIDSNPVCRAHVRDGAWKCSTAGLSIPQGARSLSARSQDRVGNLSDLSRAISLTVLRAPADQPSASTPAEPSTDAPTQGESTPSETPSQHGSSVPGGGGGGNSGSGGGGGGGSGTTGPGTGLHGWSAPTTYGVNVPTIRSAWSVRTLLAILIGVAGFLLLVAIPVKVAARSTRGHLSLRVGRITGRNRSAAERISDNVPTPPWVPIVGAIVLATVLALIGTGISAEPRSARLAIAVLIGTTTLTGGVVLASRWAAGVYHPSLRFRISPWLMLLAVLACIITHAASLSPAIVVGVLLAPDTRHRAEPGGGTAAADRLRIDARVAGRDAVIRVLALLCLAAAGWILDSLVDGHGPFALMASEFATTLCVGGIGAAIAALIPVAGTMGAALWARRRSWYAASAAGAVALAVAIYSGQSGTHLSFAAIAATTIGFAITGLVVWLWVRVIEPVLLD